MLHQRIQHLYQRGRKAAQGPLGPVRPYRYLHSVAFLSRSYLPTSPVPALRMYRVLLLQKVPTDPRAAHATDYQTLAGQGVRCIRLLRSASLRGFLDCTSKEVSYAKGVACTPSERRRLPLHRDKLIAHCKHDPFRWQPAHPLAD